MHEYTAPTYSEEDGKRDKDNKDNKLGNKQFSWTLRFSNFKVHAHKSKSFFKNFKKEAFSDSKPQHAAQKLYQKFN